MHSTDAAAAMHSYLNMVFVIVTDFHSAISILFLGKTATA